MDIITQVISTVGFPIGMCLLMGYWIKTTHDDHRDDIKRLEENHTAETKDLTEAINENTLTMQELINEMKERM